MFDRYSRPPSSSEASLPSGSPPPGGREFEAELLHALSLLHAVCCAALRRDRDLSNLSCHEDRLGGGAKRAPAVLRHTTSGMLMLRGTSVNIAASNAAQPLPVMGGLSSEERAQLGCLWDVQSAPCGDNNNSNNKKQLVQRVRDWMRTSCPQRPRNKGFNCSCCSAHLPYMDRPMLVMTWLHELLLQRQAVGGLGVPAPVLARLYTVRCGLLWCSHRTEASARSTAVGMHVHTAFWAALTAQVSPLPFSGCGV
jgi:hypothetical protein